MPPPKYVPTVFYARDKSPLEEHNGPRASIEGVDEEEEEEEEELLPKIVSDLVDYESCEEEFDSSKSEQDSKPEKRALYPEDESDEEAAGAKVAPPAKHQRRSQVNSSVPPRRSKRVASTSSLQGENTSGVGKEKPVTGKRGRGQASIKEESGDSCSVGREPRDSKRTNGGSI
ncbi:hypothetical protein FocTR4_00001862 [Fusarium oxysporum f. sp. cubense]|uniref:Uncharacterized protein n=1 Tax=Fusarium oxysporum f. sp. cubense TaxID=61366 RepID=A0A5C6T0F9_FUSOC|nr:hypothetical protein FocTR4_00001862 [Fusarium oxysporum f. sp. cubense]